MLPCKEVHWTILPSVSRELAVMLEKENVPRKRIASALGTTPAAVSQYISGKRGRKKLPPTSGNKPMPVSGIANCIVSSATRWLPCTDTPTPPPITKPRSSAT